MSKGKLYKGTFNWSGESHEFYTHASNADKAFVNFTAKLAKRVGLTRYAVAIRFINQSSDNYYIQEVQK